MPDDIETSATATADPVDTGTQQEGDTGASNASTSDPAQAGNPSEATETQAPSQLNTGEQKPLTPPQPEPVEDWKTKFEQRDKSYNEVRGYANRVQSDIQKLRQQYEGIDPQQAREALAALQRQQAAQQVKPFSKHHPDYAKTSNRLALVEAFAKATHGEDPEAQRRIQERMGVTDSDINLFRESREDQQNFLREFHAAPQDTLRDILQPLIRQEFQQRDQYESAKLGSQQWLQQNEALVQKHAQEMHSVMDPNIPASDKAAFVGQLLAKVDALQAQLSGNIEQVSTAKAQKAINMQRATGASRRTVPTQQSEQIADPVAHLAKLGISPQHPDYANRIRKMVEGT